MEDAAEEELEGSDDSGEDEFDPVPVVVTPTFADIKSAFRATRPDKATPPWSVPMKVWVIVEDDAN